ncbi:MAG: hypothetical protein C0501_07435 [Isosphaera sp.]|nr:hypothetical protein [Isosphaera sp.]
MPTRSALLALALALLAPAARADTFTVSPAGVDADDRDGKTAATAWRSLAYACDRVPAGEHTIQLESGTFPAARTAKPKNGVTIAGRGSTGDKATRVVASTDWKLGDVTANPKPTDEFLIGVAKGKGVAVRDLAMESDPKHRVSGAVHAVNCDALTLKNLGLREFRWAALFLEHSQKVTVDGCVIENGSTDKDKHHSGAIRTRWLKSSEIARCRVVNTVGTEYGYKGGGHEGVRIHHCYFEQQGEFSFESAHENEFGLEIDHNHMNRCISVPKSGQGADPNTRGFAYSVWIHDNLLTDSYTVEGPRNHLRFGRNYVRIEKTGGRVYSQHGGENRGPVWIHHNVVENLDRAFVWKNRGSAENVSVLNNTVYAADAKDRAAAFIDAFHDAKQPVKGWVVKNNVFVAAKEQPRNLVSPRAAAEVAFAANLCVNLKGVPDGNFVGDDPGFRLKGDRPWPFYVPAAADSFVVGRGVDVGFPFKGKGPALGAYEFGEERPLTGIPEKK